MLEKLQAVWDFITENEPKVAKIFGQVALALGAIALVAQQQLPVFKEAYAFLKPLVLAFLKLVFG